MLHVTPITTKIWMFGHDQIKLIVNIILNRKKVNFFCSYTLFQVAQAITPNIIMFLPRNINLEQVSELSWLSSPPLELEVKCLQHLIHPRIVFSFT